ncbi:MAG: ABC transporter ATP-binding protein, partial [Pirellulales bacterium]
MAAAVRVIEISKRYRLGPTGGPGYRTLRESLSSAARAVGGRLLRPTTLRPGADAFWALRDISFDLEAGAVLGVIGRNGAGKSTLLKILGRVTKPTTGRALVRGRLGSLLEVGTGFHPELSGRENIYLNGIILGMRRGEIARRFDEIVAFAEVERFVDTPVKHYSSGMYTRLAFSVAAHLDCELLLVDEVLAVGDAGFQKKCLGVMGDLASRGRTLLFVSHNMSAVQSLCGRVAWLDGGELRLLGDTAEVVKRYLMEQNHGGNTRLQPTACPGGGAVRLDRIAVSPEGGGPDDAVTVRTPLRLEMDYWNDIDQARLSLSILVINAEGVTVFNSFPLDDSAWYGKPYPAGLFRSTCHIPADLLN